MSTKCVIFKSYNHVILESRINSWLEHNSIEIISSNQIVQDNELVITIFYKSIDL